MMVGNNESTNALQLIILKLILQSILMKFSHKSSESSESDSKGGWERDDE